MDEYYLELHGALTTLKDSDKPAVRAFVRDELAPLLDFIARNPDMRLSAPLFLVRGATA